MNTNRRNFVPDFEKPTFPPYLPPPNILQPPPLHPCMLGIFNPNVPPPPPSHSFPHMQLFHQQMVQSHPNHGLSSFFPNGFSNFTIPSHSNSNSNSFKQYPGSKSFMGNDTVFKEPILSINQSDDLSNLNLWLNSRKERLLQTPSTYKSKLSIPEFRKLLKRMVLLNEYLEKISLCKTEECMSCLCVVDGINLYTERNDEENGTSNDRKNRTFNMTVLERHNEYSTIIQKEMASIRSKLNDDVVKEMKEKINLRKKKRDRLRRKKMREKEEEENRIEMRRKKEETINKWQEKEMRLQQTIKKEKEVSKAADKTLFEVRKKISDVNKSLKTLSSLEKLRDARSIKKSGILSFDAEVTFKNRVEVAVEFLKKQLEVYEAEQRALQVMLDTELEANKEKEMKDKIKKVIQDVKQEFKLIKNNLFGPQEEINPMDEMYSFYHFYNLPNMEINAFLHVRNEWDTYLVPGNVSGGSRIPSEWVIPQEPSDERWASYLVNDS